MTTLEDTLSVMFGGEEQMSGIEQVIIMPQEKFLQLRCPNMDMLFYMKDLKCLFYYVINA